MGKGMGRKDGKRNEEIGSDERLDKGWDSKGKSSSDNWQQLRAQRVARFLCSLCRLS
jgi:hypothetical protein